MSETSYDSLQEERLATCPIKPRCKMPDDDMMLRSIRSNRLLCTHCYVHTPTGYIGKEEAKASDDRYFTGTNRDYLVTTAVIFPMALAACVVTMFVGTFGYIGWLIAFFIGTTAGTYIGSVARKATQRRVGRQSAMVAVAAVVLGALAAPTVYFLLRFGVLTFDLQVLFNLPLLICAGAMGVAIYNRFMRRI